MAASSRAGIGSLRALASRGARARMRGGGAPVPRAAAARALVLRVVALRGVALLLGLAVLLLAGVTAAPGRAAAAAAAAAAAPEPPAVARRVVSLNPSLTRMLVAIGARDALVGIDDYSARAEPAVADLPRVGGLYAPSLEAVVALAPDLVVLVPSVEQQAFRARLEQLGVAVLALAGDPVRFDGVLAAIETLGRRTGHEAAARARVAAIRAARDAVRRATAGRPRPRAVLVLQRAPLFVVGRGSFLDEMLGIAGAENLGAALDEPWPRASLEWLVAQAPDVLLDSDADPEPATAFWSRWPSLPAVRQGRVVALDEGTITMPGPDLDRALWRLARALHGDALAREAGAP